MSSIDALFWRICRATLVEVAQTPMNEPVHPPRPRALSSMHLDLKSYLSQRFGHKTLCRRDLHYIDLFAYSGRSVTYDIRLPKPVARAAARTPATRASMPRHVSTLDEQTHEPLCTSSPEMRRGTTVSRPTSPDLADWTFGKLSRLCMTSKSQTACRLEVSNSCGSDSNS